jgi:DeoR/GlpR family transcriptional regulator of sugar metabolism/ABC-type sugar transport system substrate-binding protein
MMKDARHARILALLDEGEELTLGEIARRIGRVSEITVRRDVAELAELGRLERRRGGASRLGRPERSERETSASAPAPREIENVDALILPPIDGRGADTLRMLARRRRIPFLAESSAQDFGAYLGPDNFRAGRDLGNVAGRSLKTVLERASLLFINIGQLPNTRARCEGFERGFRETFKGATTLRTVDSRGSYRIAFEGAMDALQVHPDVNVIFGVNDHAVLAGLDAAERLGIKVQGFGIGGEGSRLFEVLANRGALRACAALFPEIVGMVGVDALARALEGQQLPEVVGTPHAIISADNLTDYYEKEDGGWSLRSDAMLSLAPALANPPQRPEGPTRTVGFAPHYPAHDWYRAMERAIGARCERLGLELHVAAPQAGIAREIHLLREMIAREAVRQLAPGETVIVNEGPVTPHVTAELLHARNLTVITNSLDVLSELSANREVKVILTSGELHSKLRCLVGPSLGALFETVRADAALISVDGLTPAFGPSAGDERLALAAQRLSAAARRVIVLADHSLVGLDATHRICPPKAISQIVTDGGTLPKDRLSFSEAGILLTIAEPRETAPPVAQSSTNTSEPLP